MPPNTVYHAPKYIAEKPTTLDAFGRQRVSEPTTLFDSQMQYDTSPIFWESVVTDTSGNAAVAHVANKSSVTLTVEAEDTIVRQSRQYHRYQPGKSQLVDCTFVPATPAAGVTQRVGYFDARNGIFFEIDGTTINIVRRTYVTGTAADNEVAQANWNTDPMNGTGNSGINLDWTKGLIFWVDMEWLGVGAVRCGFVVDGIRIVAHQFLNTNTLGSVYMTTANLPVRYEISVAAGTAGAHVLTQICSEVSSEGGFVETYGIQQSASTGAAAVSTTTRKPLLSIRPAGTFNSIVNRMQILPQEIQLAARSKSCFFEVVYGGALTNPSFAAVDATYSGAEKDVAATAITGGIVVWSGVIPAAALGAAQSPGRGATDLLGRLPLTLNVAGNHPTSPFTDSLSIVATTAETPDATLAYASIMWRELR